MDLLQSKVSNLIIPKRNVGIFWDEYNCPIPNPELSFESVIKLVRHAFVTDRSDFHEVEFTVITEGQGRKNSQLRGGGGAGAAAFDLKIKLIEVDKARRPAQRVLRDEVREFIRNYGHTSPFLVLICDHIQFVKEIAYYKLEYDCYIALVYGPICTFQLLPQWDEVYYFRTFCERLDENRINRLAAIAITDKDEETASEVHDKLVLELPAKLPKPKPSTDTNSPKVSLNTLRNLKELKEQIDALKKLYENPVLSQSGSQVRSHSYGKYQFWISLKDGGAGTADIDDKLRKFFEDISSGVKIERDTKSEGGRDGNVWITFNDGDIAIKNIQRLVLSGLLGTNFSMAFVNNYLQKDTTDKKYFIINCSDTDELDELKQRIWNKRQVSAEDETIAKYFVTLAGFPTDLTPSEIQDDLMSFLEEIKVHGNMEYVSMDGLACLSFQHYEEVITAISSINSPLFYDGSGYKLKLDGITSKHLEDLRKIKPTMLATPCCEEKPIVP